MDQHERINDLGICWLKKLVNKKRGTKIRHLGGRNAGSYYKEEHKSFFKILFSPFLFLLPFKIFFFSPLFSLSFCSFFLIPCAFFPSINIIYKIQHNFLSCLLVLSPFPTSRSATSKHLKAPQGELSLSPVFSTVSRRDTKRTVAFPSPCWLKASSLTSYTTAGSERTWKRGKIQLGQSRAGMCSVC